MILMWSCPGNMPKYTEFMFFILKWWFWFGFWWFNNISVISWQSVLLVKETGENHRPAAIHWQSWSHNVVSSTTHLSDRIWIWFIVFKATFSNISAISWRPVFSGGRSRSTRREPPTMGKQLVNFITWVHLFVIYKAGHEPTPYWW